MPANKEKKEIKSKRPSDNNTDDDEEIARELQDQFRREVEQYASSYVWSEIHSVFTPEGRSRENGANNRTSEENFPVVDAIPEQPNFNDTPRSKKKGTFVHDLSFSTTSTSPSTSLDGSPLDSRTSSGTSIPVSIDEFIEVDIDIRQEEELVRQQRRQQRKDEELARRLEREIRDEALAREMRAAQGFGVQGSMLRALQGSTTDEALARRLQEEADTESRRGRRRGLAPDATLRQKIIYYGTRFVSVILVLCVTYLVFIMVFGRNINSGLDPQTWLPGWPEGDPSHGSVGENSVWDMNGSFKGLTLQVLNNLEEDSDWNQYFETAIADWNNGTPDAVNLYLRLGTYDPECRAVRKAMKVCNGNYGPTDWRGVNQILMQDDYIITSLAKMNDYYLEGTNMAEKQYTMCHELGHGLGLGHSDENFYNKDLGNCMDYTERPQNNMHPDESNFRTLEQLYGNVDGTSVRPSNRRIRTRRTVATIHERLLDEEFEFYSQFLSDPIHVSTNVKQLHTSDGWRLLRRTETIEHHVRDLGNGYSIQTSILLAR